MVSCAKRFPKPYAVRDAVPGMRIRGCRAAQVPERQKVEKPAAELEKLQKRTHTVTVLSDSERDEAEAICSPDKELQAELSDVREAASAGRFEVKEL